MNRGAYFNEFDKGSAQWLRNIIADTNEFKGVVDERDIRTVGAGELAGYQRVHLFAGIGGWEIALQLAGWDDRPVWTASFPCQPYSISGKKEGDADPRNLWPTGRELIAFNRPPTIFGEQVASDKGRIWFSGVRSDLEAIGYKVGAADLCAAGINAPHIRQRLYWFAVLPRCVGVGQADCNSQRPSLQLIGNFRSVDCAGRGEEAAGDKSAQANQNCGSDGAVGCGGLGDSQSLGLKRGGSARDRGAGPEDSGPASSWLGSPNQLGQPGEPRRGPGSLAADRRSNVGTWDKAQWILCADGKARRIEPGTMPLAHGVPGRVVKIRAYGNAILPDLAAKFIRAADEAMKELGYD